VSYLSTTPIEPAEIIQAISGASDGAVVTFVGAVRDHHAGRQVVALRYESYGPMAESESARISEEAESQFGARVAIRHRIGALIVGDVAVVVAAAAPHRDAAFAAARWTIDEVKRRVPIWKHEEYADGTTAWVDPTAPGGIVR
jgi:molybdopterin synthase catalytic subunit